ncbi:hypothetical protein B1B04_24965 [Lysinibacillus sp. KCTC 33748]|uniref:hypothetical protein n=1 Tax=unclassified Lysinibacillus TaxID=2636778 RepID=UPI0009A8CEFF|nr:MULTISPECIES: hypothetical protein [unclassified Lysinibacillus]OXS65583.1 hypothetical protein B1B04_24965 [Lysinibacillus sp. KCTC 33748]SKC19607.1 hypothetical protein SAMN06295926_1453 [Lysinibacillus sp. AC-3]
MRIIGVSGSSSDSTSVSIFIDGREHIINPVAQSSIMVFQSLVFEKSSLSNEEHNVQIKNNQSKYFAFDCIDIDSNGELKQFKKYIKKLALKNPSDCDKIYSLSENTLIHLLDSSDKNMILHGIEQGKEIQLDIPFDKHRHFNDTPVANVSGKVFTHDIGKVNTLNIIEIGEKKKFEPIYTWYNTNMTSDTAPAPLVASASSVNSSIYGASKAFDGNTVDSS